MTSGLVSVAKIIRKSPQSAVRESEILRLLKDKDHQEHPNITHLLESFFGPTQSCTLDIISGRVDINLPCKGLEFPFYSGGELTHYILAQPEQKMSEEASCEFYREILSACVVSVPYSYSVYR